MRQVIQLEFVFQSAAVPLHNAEVAFKLLHLNHHRFSLWKEEFLF